MPNMVVFPNDLGAIETLPPASFASACIKVKLGVIASSVPGVNSRATPSIEPLAGCGHTTRIGFVG
jgi:hypothetical protein